jgi:putative transposase
VTFSTFHRRQLFFVEIYVHVFLKTLYRYRREGRYSLHAFVVMPEHVHLLLTPAINVTIERAIQLIKGAYSHELGGIVGRRQEVWERGFTDHRIRNEVDYVHHRNYIHQNPVERKMVSDPLRISVLLRIPGIQVGSVALSG